MTAPTPDVWVHHRPDTTDAGEALEWCRGLPRVRLEDQLGRPFSAQVVPGDFPCAVVLEDGAFQIEHDTEWGWVLVSLW